MAYKYRPRKQYKFWLFEDDEQDQELARKIQRHKSSKRFTQVIRDSLELYWALENGNLDALFDKFPQYRAQLQPDNTALIEEFRQLLQQNRAGGAEPAPTLPGPKPLAAPRLPLPLLDDDDDDLPTLAIERKKTDEHQVVKNFIDGLFSEFVGAQP